MHISEYQKFACADKARLAQLEERINELPESTAALAPQLYKEWTIGEDVKIDDRREFIGVLYKARQSHTCLEVFAPDITPALWATVGVEEGSRDNPFHYNGNMELFEGKYYEQGDVLYLCTRDSGVPLYNNLADLVGIYVQLA